MMPRHLIVLILLVCFCGSLYGQDSTARRPAGGSISVVTEPDSMVVLLDGVARGRAPILIDSIPAGVHVIRALGPAPDNWTAAVVADTLTVADSATLEVRLVAYHGLMIRSIPDGATVSAGDTVYGTTPLAILPGERVMPGSFQITKPGYDPVMIDPRMAVLGVLSVPLVSHDGRHAESMFLREMSTGPRPWKLVVSGGIAVLAGAASAYFKISADSRQAEFLETGNPAMDSERKRLDSAAALTFALTQVALAAFCYFLLAD